ncbi:aminotransferase class IV [Planctomicrobium sp. SH668]|uniref:aminotransferase class IV n=1 Tax=Planctomicrobium sp. SH668 TaxID=3448126 RepID=UPI003F5B0F5D
MPHPHKECNVITYLNGSYIPFNDAKIPIYDLGLAQGATVTERLRTVKHQPYLVEEHLDRLFSSLNSIGVSVDLDRNEFKEAIAHVASTNSQWIDAQDDLSVVVFVTAGQLLGDSNGLCAQGKPTVCVYSAPLPLSSWAKSHQLGVSLVVPATRQIPADSIDPRIKHRSRLNWFIAENQARQIDPTATALLLDNGDFVTETSSGNIVILNDGTLFTPRSEATLNGIALATVCEIAEEAGMTVIHKQLTVEEVLNAQEAFLTSSTYCILPIGKLNQQRIGEDVPGPVTQKLVALWSEKIGLHFAEQSLNSLNRSANQP